MSAGDTAILGSSREGRGSLFESGYSEKPSATVSLDTTAKGVTTVKVSVTAPDVATAAQEAEHEYDRLRAKYASNEGA